VLRVIMLNNNIKILLVSFVHHIELQKFLNAPRNLYSAKVSEEHQGERSL